jgi:hypothetical protein
MRSNQSAAIPVTSSYQGRKQKPLEKKEAFSPLMLIQQALFSIFIFIYEWGKYLVGMVGKKQHTKIGCSPTRLGLRQPEQVLRREEIQERSMDSLIHRTNAHPQHFQPDVQRQPYLHHYPDQQEHYTTSMVITPRPPSSGFVDDLDEVGTCVESIVPDTHYPNESDGRPSPWKVVSHHQNIPSSSSFLSSSLSGWGRQKRGEQSNWVDEDDVSYE